jgi:hypothetical protein
MIGSVAATHYSFMGATDPVQMPHARELAGRLKADAADAVILPSVRPLCTRAVSALGH